jgi:hypothetical protein
MRMMRRIIILFKETRNKTENLDVEVRNEIGK